MSDLQATLIETRPGRRIRRREAIFEWLEHACVFCAVLTITCLVAVVV